MRYLKTYKLFENRFEDIKKTLDTLKKFCLEFEDNECHFEIWPKMIVTSFYVEIDINRRTIQYDEERSGYGPLPNWFIVRCREIEHFMSEEGYKTLPSIRYGTDWENFDTIDELAEHEGLTYKVRLEFQPTK
jgi:hypothetical protein